MSARISRKEIHYVLFKNTNFWMFGLFFFFYFFIMGAYFPFFPDLAT
ncbi:MFS transporter [Escherichia coli]